MENDKDTADAIETLKLISEDLYNTDRPSYMVIEELVQVIKLFERKLNILE